MPPHEHAARFYDKLREHIHSFVGDGKLGDLLLLVPDIFILLWRLANDERVSGKNKGLLISGIAYFISPIDVLPEALLGPIGYVDDLVLAVFILNKVLTDTDASVLREHWSGHEDVLDSIHRVLTTVDSLVTDKIINKLKKMM
ncbi:MAG TPA: DUF1232 domain-containing protein [Thermoanaerobaculia bacterium]|nr:DUF1232 domain-containing protein [Thermoanaerobaculia bacterium]